MNRWSQKPLRQGTLLLELCRNRPLRDERLRLFGGPGGEVFGSTGSKLLQIPLSQIRYGGLRLWLRDLRSRNENGKRTEVEVESSRRIERTMRGMMKLREILQKITGIPEGSKADGDLSPAPISLEEVRLLKKESWHRRRQAARLVAAKQRKKTVA